MFRVCAVCIQVDFEKRENAVQQKMDLAKEKKTQLEQTQRYKKEQMVGQFTCLVSAGLKCCSVLSSFCWS